MIILTSCGSPDQSAQINEPSVSDQSSTQVEESSQLSEPVESNESLSSVQESSQTSETIKTNESLSSVQEPELPSPIQEQAQETRKVSETPKNNEDYFTKFEKEFNNLFSDYIITEMAADLVGAKLGKKYRIGQGACEIYIFDINSEAFITAKETGKLTLEGFDDFDFNVRINDKGLALYIYGIDNNQPIIDIFDNL